MIMGELIENSFASVLVFYDEYKRTKLLSVDLAKIAKKYASKPTQLIKDLEKKYEVPIPTKCESVNILRICQVYSVPESYLKLLPAQFSDNTALPYDPIYDIRSALFDPEKVLSSKRIISSTATNAMLDNLSKCLPLLSTYEARQTKTEKSVPKAPDPNKIPKTEKSIHILEAIGLDSSSKCSNLDDMGNETLQVSPFALAYTFMKSKRRVRVIMRKRAGVGGILIGFLKAFDKHFNLLLTDVDEEYSMSAAAAKKKKNSGGASDLPETLKRHLPQLLVRGDNVVLMSSVTATNYTYAKMKKKINSGRAVISIGPKGTSTGGNSQQGKLEESRVNRVHEGDAQSTRSSNDMSRSSSTINSSSSSNSSSSRSQARPELSSQTNQSAAETFFRSMSSTELQREDVSKGGYEAVPERSSRYHSAPHSREDRDLEPHGESDMGGRADRADIRRDAHWKYDSEREREREERVRESYKDQDVRYGLDQAIESYRSLSDRRGQVDPRTDPRIDPRTGQPLSENQSQLRNQSFDRDQRAFGDQDRNRPSGRVDRGSRILEGQDIRRESNSSYDARDSRRDDRRTSRSPDRERERERSSKMPRYEYEDARRPNRERERVYENRGRGSCGADGRDSARDGDGDSGRDSSRGGSREIGGARDGAGSSSGRDGDRDRYMEDRQRQDRQREYR